MRVAKTLEIAVVISSTHPLALDVVNVCGKNPALPTQWLHLQVFLANLLPLRSVSPFTWTRALVISTPTTQNSV